MPINNHQAQQTLKIGTKGFLLYHFVQIIIALLAQAGQQVCPIHETKAASRPRTLCYQIFLWSSCHFLQTPYTPHLIDKRLHSSISGLYFNHRCSWQYHDPDQLIPVLGQNISILKHIRQDNYENCRLQRSSGPDI